MINIKHTGQRASSPITTPARSASFIVANPFGQTALAYVNGSIVFTPLRPVPVTYRTPRTQFITLGAV